MEKLAGDLLLRLNFVKHRHSLNIIHRVSLWQVGRIKANILLGFCGFLWIKSHHDLSFLIWIECAGNHNVLSRGEWVAASHFAAVNENWWSSHGWIILEEVHIHGSFTWLVILDLNSRKIKPTNYTSVQKPLMDISPPKTYHKNPWGLYWDCEGRTINIIVPPYYWLSWRMNP